MPFCTPLILMASPYATLAALEVQAAVATDETSEGKTVPPEHAGQPHGPRPPADGGFPVDALFNFGAIRDLFFARRTF